MVKRPIQHPVKIKFPKQEVMLKHRPEASQAVELGGVHEWVAKSIFIPIEDRGNSYETSQEEQGNFPAFFR